MGSLLNTTPVKFTSCSYSCKSSAQTICSDRQKPTGAVHIYYSFIFNAPRSVTSPSPQTQTPGDELSLRANGGVCKCSAAIESYPNANPSETRFPDTPSASFHKRWHPIRR